MRGGLLYGSPMGDSLERLFQAVTAARNTDPSRSRTARLMRAGREKMAKKVAEKVEAVQDAMAEMKQSATPAASPSPSGAAEATAT